MISEHRVQGPLSPLLIKFHPMVPGVQVPLTHRQKHSGISCDGLEINGGIMGGRLCA